MFKNDLMAWSVFTRKLPGWAIAVLWVVVVLLLLVPSAWAHRASDAYLDVRDAPVQGENPQVSNLSRLQLQLSVGLADLDAAIPIDANADGRITWSEVDAAAFSMVQWVQAGTGLGECLLRWRFVQLERRSDRAFAVFQAMPTCTAGQPVVLNYALFKDLDATHRLLVSGRVQGQDLLAAASPGQTDGVVLRGAGSTGAAGIGQAGGAQLRSPWQTMSDYLYLGAHHLLEGVDHMAFLLALVLPLQLSLRRRPRDAVCSVPPAQRQRSPWAALLITVTAFTVGHSITLALVSLDALGPPPSWVEPIIAVSIGVSALLNIYPVRAVRSEHLAFAFGLIHGLAFAGLLLDAAAPAGLLLWALAGFNLGVEAGQLLAVAVWVLLSQLVVNRPQYGRFVVPLGSWALVAMSVFWFFQRIAL